MCGKLSPMVRNIYGRVGHNEILNLRIDLIGHGYKLHGHMQYTVHR